MKKKFLLKYYDNILNYLRCHFWSLIDENYRNAMATTLMTTKKYILVLGRRRVSLFQFGLGFSFSFLWVGEGRVSVCYFFLSLLQLIFGFPHRRSGFCCCFRLFWFWFQVLNDLREAFLQDMGDLRVLCS